MQGKLCLQNRHLGVGKYMETLAFILSVLGMVCACIPSLLKGKNMKLILLLVFSANILTAMSYILTDALNGAASCFVGAAQTIVNYFFDRKNKPLPKWLIAIYAGSFIIVNLLVFRHFTDAIAIAAALVFIAAICQKNGKKYRFWSLVNITLWLIYDLVNLSLGPICTHTVQLVIILVGIVMHDRKKNNP